MTRSGKTTIWLTAAALTSVSFLAGCGMNRRYANNVIRELPHSNVTIEYNCVNSANAEVQQSALQAGDSTNQVLIVTYPHPSPKYGRNYAEVTLRRDGGSEHEGKANAVTQLVTNPFKKQEALAAGAPDGDHALRLTIPREDLEFLLRDLVADSYFDREERSGGINLRVTLGSRTTHKAWDHVASLDQLAQRVHEENEKRFGATQRANKVRPASAELLPPDPDDVADDSPAPKRRGRLHAVPDF